MKASVTILVAMSLGGFIFLITTLIYLCIYNAQKVRAYGYFDISANSVLGEYSISLKEIFDLLYIDASFLGEDPDICNINNHFSNYLKMNMGYYSEGGSSPWGKLELTDGNISDFQTATAKKGMSMRSQAVKYIEESGLSEEYKSIVEEVSEAGDLSILADKGTVLEEFSALMETIAGMELPKKMNKKTKRLETVPLANPADWVYGLISSDVIFLTQAPIRNFNGIVIPTDELCSNTAINFSAMSEIDDKSKEAFMEYLIDKMDCYRIEREDRILSCELEYIVVGADSDYKNFREVIDRIFMARLQDNLRLAKADGGLVGEAYSYASCLEVCMLAPEFIEPVAQSMIYACVYLESISDLNCLLNGGKVMLNKTSHNMSIQSLLYGGRYYVFSEEGLDYRQYILAMISLMEDKEINLRAMDIMEVEVRNDTGNSNFKMDWCVEKLKLSMHALGNYAGRIEFEQIYGIY